MPKVEVSPGGVGFIKTSATKQIPGLIPGAKRRQWIDATTGKTVASVSLRPAGAKTQLLPAARRDL